MASKRFKLNIGNDGEFNVEEKGDDEKSDEVGRRKLRGEVVCDGDQYRFVRENRFEGLHEFSDYFFNETTNMGLPEKKTDKIIEMSKKLIEVHTNLILQSLRIENQANKKTIETVKETAQHLTEELDKISSTYRRLTEFRKNELFIEPKEISLAFKWKTKTSTKIDLGWNSV